MAPKNSKFLALMPKGSRSIDTSPDCLSEMPDTSSIQNEATETRPEHSHPSVLSDRPPIPVDVWESWYVSISIGRPATKDDVIAWRERQVELVSRGLQDSTDHSAWLMVQNALKNKGQAGAQSSGRATTRSENHFMYQQPGRPLHPSPFGGYTPLSPEEQAELGKRTQLDAFDFPMTSTFKDFLAGDTFSVHASNQSTTAGSNDNHAKEPHEREVARVTQQDRPRGPRVPAHRRAESLHEKVIKREHARAISNYGVPTSTDAQASLAPVELSNPPIADTTTATNIPGEDSTSPSLPPVDPSRTHRRTISASLATKVEGFATRADDRRKSRDNSPSNSPPDTPTFDTRFGDLVSSLGEASTSDPQQTPSATGPAPYVPPNKRDGPKPWLSKNWREPEQDGQQGDDAG